MERSLSPVQEPDRISSLDVLRGFALLGILTMNIGSFSMPNNTYFDPTAWGSLDGLNGWVWRLTHVFADLKFMAIFSMLFGAGIILMSERALAKGQRGIAVHYRRMFWLILFGAAHGYLLWYGDILFWYGVTGLWVFVFRKLRARWLITWGVIFLGVASLLSLAGGLSVDYWPAEELEATVAEMKPSEEAKAHEVAMYRGGLADQFEIRAPETLSSQTETYLFWAAWRVAGLMLLGMAFFKLGIFSAARSRKLYLRLILAGVLIGIPIILLGMRYNQSINWEAPYYFFIGTQYNYWASILVALAWVSVIMLMCQSGVLAGLRARLAAVGRTAFSNYILQTLICTTIFYGHGFGLFGSVDRVAQAGIVLAVWLFQLFVTPIWLRRFKFGPLEWVWRSLVYMKAQPMLRNAS